MAGAVDRTWTNQAYGHRRCAENGAPNSPRRSVPEYKSWPLVPIGKDEAVSCPIALFPVTSERERSASIRSTRTRDKGSSTRKSTRRWSPITSSRATRSASASTWNSSQKRAIAIESKRTIDIDEFVPRKETDELYFNNPYYIVPDGEVGQQAFDVIREAIRQEGLVATGKVVFSSRGHVIALEARDKPAFQRTGKETG